MSDCKHIIRYKTEEKIPALSREQLEAGYLQMVGDSYLYGPCVGCLRERVAALEEQRPLDGTAARIGGTAVLRIECDPQVARALETLAPVLGPLLAKWLGVGKCQHGVQVGTYCGGCYGPAKTW